MSTVGSADGINYVITVLHSLSQLLVMSTSDFFLSYYCRHLIHCFSTCRYTMCNLFDCHEVRLFIANTYYLIYLFMPVDVHAVLYVLKI